MQPKSLDLSIIVAMTPDRVIGREGTLPWRMPSDMKRFKEITTQAGVVIMGRKTWDSLPAKFKPLPGRHNIILTRGCSLRTSDSVEFVTRLEDVYAAVAAHGSKGCVIGGAEIYRRFLPLVQTAYITKIHAPIEGDTFFPSIQPYNWRCVVESPVRKWHPNDEYPTSFEELERVTELEHS